MSDLETYRLPASRVFSKRHERPIWIWDRVTGRFVWANGAGIEFWGADGLMALQAKLIPHDHPAFDTVSHLAEAPVDDANSEVRLTFPERLEETELPAFCRFDQIKERPVMIVEITGNGSLHRARTNHSLPSQDRDDPKIIEREEPPRVEAVEEPARNGAAFPPLDHHQPEEASAFGGEVPFNQLDELARLIEAAQAGEEKHPQLSDNPVPGDNAAPEEDVRPLPDIEAAERAFDDLSIEWEALKGARDGAEIEAVLRTSSQPLALVHVPRILHANDIFVSEFGYGDFASLGNDGTDWILPHSRAQLLSFAHGGASEPLMFHQVRLCSGRTIERPVYIMPVTLTRFKRQFLLITLGEAEGGVRQSDSGYDHNPLLAALNDIPMMSVINHEVRTPLNIILGFSEMITREEFGPLGHPKYGEYAQDIHKSAEHALQLINDMLDLSKLKSGNWSIDPHKLDLNAIVREQVHLMRGLALEQDVRLRSLLEENLPDVTADQRVLVQILINLISNGIKFSPAMGAVTVSTGLLDHGGVELSVEDSGEGMSERELEQALYPFQQTDRGARQYGTGLGLPIVKALAKASNIGFSIASRPNEGTRITLIIPS